MDAEIRLAAKLARAAGLVHPMDWARVRESHNDYEWAMQIALMQVEPWGDDRADLRAAVNTARIVASNSAAEVSSEQMVEMIHGTRQYLKIHHPDDED